MRIGLELLIIGACMGSWTGQFLNQISGTLYAISAVLLGGTLLDRQYVEAMTSGAQPTVSECWSALIYGLMPKPPHLTDEEQLRKRTVDEGQSAVGKENSFIDRACED